MNLKLERVLLLLAGAAAVLLALTFINYVWPFTPPNQPVQRIYIGLAVNLSNFFFAISAFALIHTRKILIGLVLVAIWSIAALIYGVLVLLNDPLSAWTIMIFLGQMVFCGFMAHLSIQEARSSGLLKNGSTNTVA